MPPTRSSQETESTSGLSVNTSPTIKSSTTNEISKTEKSTLYNDEDAIHDHTPAPSQALVSAALGGVAGFMDYSYCENFGAMFGVALLVLQIIDHEGLAQMPWNNNQPVIHEAHSFMSRARLLGRSSAASAVGREMKTFCGNNVYIFTGYLGGFLLVKGILMGIENMNTESVE